MGVQADKRVGEDSFSLWDSRISVGGTRRSIGGDWAVIAVAVEFAIAGTMEMGRMGPPPHWTRLLLDGFLLVGMPLGALLGGVVLHRSEFNLRERWIAANWYMGGIVFISGLVLWSQLPALLAGQSIVQVINPFLLLANLGGILGLIAGFNRARSAQNARLIRQVQTRRDQLTFINSLLRHNVLNSIQAVMGYAELIQPRLEGQEAEFMDRLEVNSERITELIDDVRILISTLEGNVDARPVDLSEMLRRQSALLEQKFDGVDLTTDIARDVSVAGNAALGAGFENLLDNAVVHNDSDPAEVTLTLERVDGAALVTITDNGPGIPQDIIDRYVDSQAPEDSRGESLGLYLSRVLIDLFDGDLEIQSNDPRGTTVRVSLPVVG